MKKCKWIVAGLMSLTLVGCAAMGDKEGAETVVPAEQLPPAVRATFAKEAGGAAIKEADMEVDKGKKIYEADVMISGQNYEIKVAEDGTLVSKAVDKEADEKAPQQKK